ncbi:monofunctional biosynthetic peptidoglycan transglycosylase [Xanthobacter tagetidis]|uniref:Biosynthetic peptidoglycan transglycosylase n=1 Tax=Xanthobacter tagetidis TaxID=60216 RepID=A0A3L7AGU8_9HYPH|nr:monofunctional biosynthetic peptidoglycan transglycosylase [Xanthobacter tagetidis]MBB6306450.1 monofunctional biosynthetic peptidoglycan transglycosylase [Xanthobacter tagetidis]RLP79703.1 monofunctional biosynthetic peptidoglycan transglycosylase [Xanthobacter tagetidis]
MIRLLLRLALIVVAIPLVLSVLYTVVNPVSTLMIGRWLSGERVERVWTPLSEMSPALVRTVIASEDASFCRHPGVDLEEMRQAIEKADEIEEVRGASTISMQVTKNLFLWPGRDLIRKAIEIPLALWLDLVLSKERMVEIYLNIAEWGPDGEFGVEAGAQRAFGIPAARVNASQAALLAVMLPNPIRRDAGKPTANLQRLASRLRERVPKEGPELVACLSLGK